MTVPTPPRRVTDAQRAALRLIAGGQYVYDESTGGARHHTLTKTARIARRTLLVLIESGLAEYDDLYYGKLRLTAAGHATLHPTR